MTEISDQKVTYLENYRAKDAEDLDRATRLNTAAQRIKFHQSQNGMETAVDVEGLARSFGIMVKRIAPPDADPDFDGRIRRCDDGQSFVIEINKDNPAAVQRFTIAHELSHAILHPESIGPDGLYRLKKKGHRHDIRERQADALGAEIVLPARRLRMTIDRIGSDCRSIAVEYGVSVKAVEIRLGH